MPVRYLSDPELARLSSWPDEIAVEDAVTYFTLSADDLSWLAGFNRQHNRLAVAVQLSTLPWLGWIPDDLVGCPPLALDRLALALGIAPDTSSALLAEYGGWQGRTRREPASPLRFPDHFEPDRRAGLDHVLDVADRLVRCVDHAHIADRLVQRVDHAQIAGRVDRHVSPAAGDARHRSIEARKIALPDIHRAH
jgi:Domain of unknown function (DUF4158)